jgi:hypothetical protein
VLTSEAKGASGPAYNSMPTMRERKHSKSQQ